MGHEEYLELMSAALDGELTAQARRELDAHLAVCPDCAAQFEEMSRQSAALRQLDCALPEGLHDRVMSGLPEQETAPARRRSRWGLLAACLALVVFGGGVALANSPLAEGQAFAPLSLSDEPKILAPEISSMPVSVSGQPVLAEPDFYYFGNAQYLRVCWGFTPEAPSARIIGSADSLADFLARFPEDDLSAVAGAYGEDFFQTRRLLAVVVEANSGSVRFQLAPQGLTWDSVDLLSQTPEIGTCDMAAWLIFAEVDTMFEDGQELTVTVSGRPAGGGSSGGLVSE